MLPLMQSGIRMKISRREPYPHFYVNNIHHAELKHFIGRWMFKEMFHNCHHVDWNELSYIFYESPWFISLPICCAILPLCSSLFQITFTGLVTSQDLSEQCPKHKAPL